MNEQYLANKLRSKLVFYAEVKKVNTNVCGKQKLPVTITMCIAQGDSNGNGEKSGGRAGAVERERVKIVETIAIPHEKAAQVFPFNFPIIIFYSHPISSLCSVVFLSYLRFLDSISLPLLILSVHTRAATTKTNCTHSTFAI